MGMVAFVAAVGIVDSVGTYGLVPSVTVVGIITFFTLVGIVVSVTAVGIIAIAYAMNVIASVSAPSPHRRPSCHPLPPLSSRVSQEQVSPPSLACCHGLVQHHTHTSKLSL